MYRFYRMLWNKKYKYCETFNSTLDPNYHELINYCNDNLISWKLVQTFDNKTKFSKTF